MFVKALVTMMPLLGRGATIPRANASGARQCLQEGVASLPQKQQPQGAPAGGEA